MHSEASTPFASPSPPPPPPQLVLPPVSYPYLLNGEITVDSCIFQPRRSRPISASSQPPARPSRRHQLRRNPRIPPSPQDKAACARFRLAKKKSSTKKSASRLSGVQDAAPLTTASFSLPSIRPTVHAVMQTVSGAAVRITQCLTSGISPAGIRYVGSTLWQRALQLATVALSIVSAMPHPTMKGLLAAPLRSRTSRPPTTPTKSKSRLPPRYLLWALGGYATLIFCFLLACGLRHYWASVESHEDMVPDSRVWLADLDMVDLEALRDAYPQYDFYVLPL
ncbi:hypothetical protein OH76DRAFT_517353 [Lentinus brumalis]|uniref:Uncharacterized protein n=1 Tax=Lentinus brumalis TaxID=2498619 RepID=A0A371DAK2_9APHY|nr:hypothetical protein OH76DRAFT_1486200 [Polyporus brumalis]RDX49569.1 hypothetical protein OH76DRAFT_517353 [Polyporus brumalis]